MAVTSPNGYPSMVKGHLNGQQRQLERKRRLVVYASLRACACAFWISKQKSREFRIWRKAIIGMLGS